MTYSDRYLEFKSSWGRYEDNNDGTFYTARPRIKFTGDFSGIRFVIRNINIDRRYDEGGRYLDTEANPGTPYAPQYPGSPATKKYVDDNIPTNVSDLTNDSNFQTATQVSQAISTAVSSAYKYKGSVTSYSNLPSSGNTEGDVWNVTDTGMNYAWTGSAWDALGATVDLSNYIAKNNTTSFTPTGDYNPATKKYVDDKMSSGTTAPSSPVEGQLWYDTTNDVLKSYNGTTWVEVGGGATTNVLRFDIGERYGLNDLIGQSVANIVNAWYELGTGTQGKNTIILSANNGQYRTYDFLVTSVSDRIPGPDEEQWGAIHAIGYYNSDEFFDSMPQSLCYLDIYYNTETKICTDIQEFTQSPITRLDSPFPLDFIWVGTEADYQDITEPHPQTLYLTIDIPLKSYQEIIAMTNVQDVYNELNLQPARYIQKFTSEGHFYNSANGKWLSSDGTIGNIPTWGNYRVRVASGMDTFDFTTTAPAP